MKCIFLCSLAFVLLEILFHPFFAILKRNRELYTT